MDIKTDLYNSSFDEIKDLTWYPWVGTEYPKGKEFRLLIVGESHYAQDENMCFNIDYYNNFINDKKSTQTIVEQEICDISNRPFFRNTYHALFGANKIVKKFFWTKVAFYNYIQSPMKTRDERPSKENYYLGWETFYRVLKVLKPTHCIFLGSEGSKYMYPVLKMKSDISLTIDQGDERIGRCWGKTAKIKHADFDTDITLIQHPSKCFKWQEWNIYLMKRNAAILQHLGNEINCE